MAKAPLVSYRVPLVRIFETNFRERLGPDFQPGLDRPGLAPARSLQRTHRRHHCPGRLAGKLHIPASPGAIRWSTCHRPGAASAGNCREPSSGRPTAKVLEKNHGAASATAAKRRLEAGCCQTRPPQLYTNFVGFATFVFVLAVARRHGTLRRAGSAILSLLHHHHLCADRHHSAAPPTFPEYHVAGRRVPACFNENGHRRRLDERRLLSASPGWPLSSGYQGWLSSSVDRRLRSGGVAPGAPSAAFRRIHHSRFSRRSLYSAVPRFGWWRWGAAIPASLRLVVAQIHGVGVITSRFINLQFEIGVFVGPRQHPGVLLPGYAGGDLDPGRPVRVVIIIAYMTPVALLAC